MGAWESAFTSALGNSDELCMLEPWTQGFLGGAAVWCLPLAQGAILKTRDQIPHQAPGAWSRLLPLPMSLPLSLSLYDYHK